MFYFANYKNVTAAKCHHSLDTLKVTNKYIQSYIVVHVIVNTKGMHMTYMYSDLNL